MTSAQLINQSSGAVEYYTPMEIIEAARTTMGGIDLDPASSEAANERVKADRFFTEDMDGLKQEWSGRVWMNHPFGAGWTACDENCQRKTCKTRGHIYHDIPDNHDWINKLVCAWMSGRVPQACCITFASTSERWFRDLLVMPQCYLFGRTGYVLPDGKQLMGCTKGSVVTYFGTDDNAFYDAFHKLGEVKVSYEPTRNRVPRPALLK